MVTSFFTLLRSKTFISYLISHFLSYSTSNPSANSGLVASSFAWDTRLLNGVTVLYKSILTARTVLQKKVPEHVISLFKPPISELMKMAHSSLQAKYKVAGCYLFPFPSIGKCYMACYLLFLGSSTSFSFRSLLQMSASSSRLS